MSTNALKLLVIVLFITVMSGCASGSKNVGKKKPADVMQEISQKVIQEAQANSIKRVAVMEFAAIDGEESPEGKLFAERIISILINDGSLNVIERSRIDKVLEEQKLQASGIIDSSTAKGIGEVLGVDAVLMGTVARLEDKSEVNSRLVKVQTGLILCAVTGETVLKLSGVSSSKYAVMKSNDPKKYREVIDRNRELIKLRKNKPVLFRKLMNTRKRLFKLAEKNPKKFIKMMDQKRIIPIGANMMEVKRTLKLLREYSPEDYKKLCETRRKLTEKKEVKVKPKTKSGRYGKSYRGPKSRSGR